MITQVTELHGPLRQDFLECVRAYCKRAGDGMKPEDFLDILPRVFDKSPSAWLFLGLDDVLKVKAFALVRLVHDHGLGWAVDLWHVYVDPHAPELFGEGLETISKAFAGVKRLQFCSSRNIEGRAWTRLLKDYGFTEKAVIFEKEV